MTTIRQAFQLFEKQWGAVRSANRTDRKDGVGLLTPKLLKQHIDSGKMLVLPYGRKGLTVSYTPADLKAFSEAIVKAKGQHKANLAGVPLMHLEAMSSEADKLRVHDIKAATLYKFNGNILYFRVTASGETASAPSHYQVRVRLDEWYDLLSDISPYPSRARRAAMGRISIDCGCGRHQYWYRYLAGVGNFAVTPPGEKDFPKIRNPKLTGACCKHVLKVLRVLKSGSIHNLIAKELERQAGAEGYMDAQGRRFLKVSELEKAKRAKGSDKDHKEAVVAFRNFRKAGKAFAKKLAGKEMKKRLNDLEMDIKVREAKERAPKATVKAERAKTLVQRIKDVLDMAESFGLDRDKAISKFAEKSGVPIDTIQAIIKKEGM